ncbi:MAG: hypothetical protein AAFV96_08810, partial [Pseudomonadota bacterium]
RHRRAAFEAAMFMMDYLKTRAPFWKKEAGPEGDPAGGTWVDARDSDDIAASKAARRCRLAARTRTMPSPGASAP